VLGASLVTAGIATTATALIASVPVMVAPVGWVIAGLGMGFTYQVGTLVVLEEAPPNQVGQLSSALQLAELISVAVATGAGGAIVGVVVRHAGTRRVGIALVDIMTVVAAIGCVTVCTRLPHRPTPQPQPDTRSTVA
jgi:MFS family permease